MENVIFKQKFGKKAKYVTYTLLFLCVAISVLLYFKSTASFLSAWFILLSVSLILLVWIGMPRSTIMTEYGIRLSCTLKLVTIDNIEQISIQRVRPVAIPILATMGFMGYTGYYYFKRDKFICQVMARNMDNLVLIRYASGKKIVVGVPDVDTFIETAEKFGCKIEHS